MNKNVTKEFDRSVCFTFFEDFRKTAIELQKDFGKEIVADYYNAIADYALYGAMPELTGAIKYIWPTTKSTIDANIKRRERGFGREDTEQTDNILQYKKENPNATQRQIAEATGCSSGKVNKVLKSASSSTADTFTDTSTYSHSITTREREREHASQGGAFAEKTELKSREDSRKRSLEELSYEEKTELVAHYKNRTMLYPVMYKHYNLLDGCLNKETLSKLEEDMRQQVCKKTAEAREQAKLNALIKHRLSMDEANELFMDLCSWSWDDTINAPEVLEEWLSNLDLSAQELLAFFRINSWATCVWYKEHAEWEDRLIIDQQHRWEWYNEFLADCIDKTDELRDVISAFENSSAQKIS